MPRRSELCLVALSLPAAVGLHHGLCRLLSWLRRPRSRIVVKLGGSACTDKVWSVASTPTLTLTLTLAPNLALTPAPILTLTLTSALTLGVERRLWQDAQDAAGARELCLLRQLQPAGKPARLDPTLTLTLTLTLTTDPGPWP